MALITCPECKVEISDKALSCPHCGYPICRENSTITYDVILSSIQENNKIEVIAYLRRILNTGLAETKKIVDNTPQTILKNVSVNNIEKVNNALENLGCVVNIAISSSSDNNDDNKITKHYNLINEGIQCPRCGSSSVTTGKKGFSLLTGFLGSNKTVNRCGKCGYSWQPR